MAASSSNPSHLVDSDDDKYEVSSDPELYEEIGVLYDELVFSDPDPDVEVTRDERIKMGMMSCGGKRRFVVDEIYKKYCPEDYQLFMNLCGLALTHYNTTHAGETYELVSMNKGSFWFNGDEGGIEATLTMSAKNLKGDVKTMKAVAIEYTGDREGTRKIVRCDLL